MRMITSRSTAAAASRIALATSHAGSPCGDKTPEPDENFLGTDGSCLDTDEARHIGVTGHASCWLRDLSNAAFMTSPGVKIASKVPFSGEFSVMDPKGRCMISELEPDGRGGSGGAAAGNDPTSSMVTEVSTMCHPDVPNVSSSVMPPEVPSRATGSRKVDETEVVDDVIPLNDEDPNFPFGRAEASSSSSSFGSRVSSDEDTLDEHLRRKCGISEEIVLVAPSLADRADAPPPGYMTLFENYFDQCLLWFPLPRFLMRFLVVHGVCLAQINPRGIRHLLGIYVLSRECGVVISTKHLSYLTDFRVRGRSEELKHTVTNSFGMALIVGFPSKDDHFEDRFFFVEISERTVEADCIDLVKTRWERRATGGSRSVRRGSRGQIPGKILGRGKARVSSREQAALEAVAKAKGSSGTSTPRAVTPMTLTPTAPSLRARSSRPLAPKTLLPPPSSGEVAEFRRLSAERARISSAVVGRETSSSHVGGLLHDEAYSVVKSKAFELSLLFDRLVGDYDEDVRSTDSELSAANEANDVLQSRLDEFAERNEVLECDALSVQKVKKDCDYKLAKLKLRCTKAEGEVVQLRGELSSANDLQRSRIGEAIAEARDEMARGFAERTRKVHGLLAEISAKVQNDMLNFAEIDANLEFIGLLQGSEPLDFPTEVKALRERRHPIYDAHDVFADLLASVQRVLEIPEVSAGATEASIAVDDDVEVTDEDDVEVTDDDEDAED
ncbi:hypothetical protein AALP_AA2G019700 [Arabis alpina]|uniref:Uncharacterized protein n=1 Tax=Arabis alpina TaxID=50452 RepID=A0A087HER6_ARAAL|nr:hypothetical protein AALP_AA2G019700 [Arabis alpina]